MYDEANFCSQVDTQNFHITAYVLNYHHNHFTTLFTGPPGEPVPEENFWTLWCKGRLTDADTPTIRLGATPSGLTSAHLHHPHTVGWAAGRASGL